LRLALQQRRSERCRWRYNRIRKQTQTTQKMQNGTAALPQEVLWRKLHGHSLSQTEIAGFIKGVGDGTIADAQVGAFTMAVCARGMDGAETAALTMAMRDSGKVLDWRAAGFDGPVIDKHSTGGIGDLVTLPLAPMLAACGAIVPTLSGRGLGHTGGTLDKLESVPGFTAIVSIDRLHAVLRAAGVAIVGAGADLAPADRRMYAIRDVTGTVESIPLITASILSKKLAGNSDALVLDIKTGSGAMMTTLAQSQRLACSLVDVALRAGLPTRAVITDMNQALAPAVGNALEMRCTLAYLRGDQRPARLHQVTLRLGAELMCLAGMASDLAAAEQRLLATLADGSAAERFARMLTELGGPADFLERSESYMPPAPVIRPVHAHRAGVVAGMDARALGLAVVALGGGRTQPGAPIDQRVGFDQLVEIGDAVDDQRPLAFVHAADEAGFERAAAAVRQAIVVADAATPPPLVYQCIGADNLEAACAALS
jgi:thymidine phosphorylase